MLSAHFAIGVGVSGVVDQDGVGNQLWRVTPPSGGQRSQVMGTLLHLTI